MQGNYCPKNDVMLLIMVIKLDQGKHKRRQETQEIWYLVETTSSKWTIPISRVKMFAINQSGREKNKIGRVKFKYQTIKLNSCTIHNGKYILNYLQFAL
jgi:hypothetical protein